jgi:isoleucyl-tRNA synthetase
VVDDLSQWWLRRSRKRPEALGLLRHVLLELDKLVAPFIPFTAEDLHERLHRGTSPQTLSVHLHDWPTAHERFIDTALEQQMGSVREYVSAGLAVRKEQQIKVRQPLQSVTVPGDKLQPDLEQLMRDELNVKEVRYAPGKPVELDLNIGRELRAEGFARETMRAIQDMRKESNCRVSDKVRCQWSTEDDEVADALTAHADMIAHDTGLSAFVRQADMQGMTAQKQFDLAPGKPLQLGIRT